MATTDNFELPLPPDSLLVSGTPAIIREANGLTDAALQLIDDRAAAAQLSAADSAAAADASAQLVGAPADAAVSVLLAGTGTATAHTAKQNRHSAFVGPLKAWRDALRNQAAAPAVFVALGSSTAQGGSASTVYRRIFDRLAALYGPRTLLTNLATAKPANGVQFYNGALGGSTSANYLTDVTRDQVIALAPHVILHMVGSNDYATGVTPANYKTNLRNRVMQLRNATAAVQVLVHQQPRFDVGAPAHPWQAYGDVMAEIAAEFPTDVAYFDASEHFYVRGYTANPGGLWTADNVHLNDFGSRVFADLLAEYFGAATDYPVEVYENVTPNGGSSASATRIYTTITLPARPYLQECIFSVAAYMGSDTAGQIADAWLEVTDAARESGEQNKVIRSPTTSTMRAHGSTTLRTVIKPHTSAVFHVRYSPSGGGTMYMTSGPNYQSTILEARRL